MKNGVAEGVASDPHDTNTNVQDICHSDRDAGEKNASLLRFLLALGPWLLLRHGVKINESESKRLRKKNWKWPSTCQARLFKVSWLYL